MNISLFGTLRNMTVGVDYCVNVDKYLDIKVRSCREYLFVIFISMWR